MLIAELLLTGVSGGFTLDLSHRELSQASAEHFWKIPPFMYYQLTSGRGSRRIETRGEEETHPWVE